jgi:uncharacterized protein (TIGR02594 family)
MKVRLAAGLLVLASTTAGVTQASANVRGGHSTGTQVRASRHVLIERAQSVGPAKRRFVRNADRSAEYRQALRELRVSHERPGSRERHVMRGHQLLREQQALRERDRTRVRRVVDAEDRHAGLPGRPLNVHHDGNDPGVVALADAPGSRIVAEARRWIGTNPTTRATLWCARFMNFVLQRVGLPGTASDLAKSFTSYGKRLQGPKVGAIAVMNRGRSGGHVGVISGFDKKGDPIVISGNYSHRVAEAVYNRSRIIAYVAPEI